ncbi:MAG: hypothetical protein HY243_14330 [Proteobacteria bacterium]|nr:hypothetical protein [Pseudomonadota bacterium]
MFRGWEEFYVLVGSAAGALIGLMFVVATLTAGRDPTQVSRGARVYITPIIFHFAVVLVVGAISEIPDIPFAVVGMILALIAVTGLSYALLAAKRLFEPGWALPPDVSDKCFYGFFPAIAYLALAGAAAAVWLAPHAAVYAIGATMLVLLLIGIRNAWDLTTALVQQRS